MIFGHRSNRRDAKDAEDPHRRCIGTALSFFSIHQPQRRCPSWSGDTSSSDHCDLESSCLHETRTPTGFRDCAKSRPNYSRSTLTTKTQRHEIRREVLFSFFSLSYSCLRAFVVESALVSAVPTLSPRVPEFLPTTVLHQL
jgi:hypothetical protein